MNAILSITNNKDNISKLRERNKQMLQNHMYQSAFNKHIYIVKIKAYGENQCEHMNQP